MRKAVVVVGCHHAGKSKTINEYLKPKLRMGRYEHKFWLRRQEGFVLSQSREEAEGFILSQSLEESGKRRIVAKTVCKYSGYDLLVLAARPASERGSCLNQLRSELRSAGYRVTVVNVDKDQSQRYYRDRADEILAHLRT